MNTFEFIKAVKEMREEQKGFFASQPGTMTRTEHFKSARLLEKLVDKALKEIETGQEELFE